MKFLLVLVDNSTAVLAWLTSLFGLLTLLDVIQLNETQVGGIVTFAGATLGLLALVLTVAKRVVVTQVTSGGEVVAGQAAAQDTGSAAYTVQNEETNAQVAMVPVKPELLDAA